MQKRKLFVPILLLAVILTGCKRNPSESTPSVTPESSIVDVTSTPTTSTSPETSTPPSQEGPIVLEGVEETEGDYIGYYKTTAWPAGSIKSYLDFYEKEPVVPALTVTEVYTLLVEDDPQFDPYLQLVLPGSDRVTEYLGILETANYVIEEDAEMVGYFYATDETNNVLVETFYNSEQNFQYIFISAVFYEPGVEDAITIEGTPVTEGLFVGNNLVNVWPETTINAFINYFLETDTVPPLTVNGDLYLSLVTDNPGYDPYLMLMLVGDDRTAEYITILQAAGYSIGQDTEFPDYKVATNATNNITVEFYFDPAVDEVPAIFYVFISVATLEIPGPNQPTNPETAVYFDFTIENQMTESSVNKAVWDSAGSTFMIEKGTSTVNVGNQNPTPYFSNPLRIYAGQVVTIVSSLGATIEQVEFVVDLEVHPSSEEALLNSAPASITTAIAGNTIIFISSASSDTITFTASAQFRLYGLTIYTI